MDGWVDACVDGWTHGVIDGWIDGWMVVGGWVGMRRSVGTCGEGDGLDE